MTASNYINIHTHNHCEMSEICITNLFANAPVSDLIDNRKTYSIGLHPWHINEESEKFFESMILSSLIHPNIIAIGECGLDKAVKVPLEKQVEIFKTHITISEENRLPMILHCVKAYNDLIQIRKILDPEQPWILHGYNGNVQTSEQLLKYDFYFSFGQSLIQPNEKIKETLKTIPIDRVFFETDENTYDIEMPYLLYSQIMEIEIDKLRNQINNNFQKCFGKINADS